MLLHTVYKEDSVGEEDNKTAEQLQQAGALRIRSSVLGAAVENGR